MSAPEITVNDPRSDLLVDMARDPEGDFHKAIAGDRRLPPWFGSEDDSLPPIDIQGRVFRFIQDRCPGQVPAEWELRHNWYDRQIEFVRWLPDFTAQDDDNHVALVTWTPLDLRVWDDSQGWLPGGEVLFDYLWRCFLTNDADTRREDQQAREIEYAKKFIGALSSAVSQGVATNEELEEYELQLKIADPDGEAESLQLANDMIPFLKRKMKDLGI